MATKQKITYCLWLNNGAEEAVNFYTSVFPDAKKTNRVYNPVDTPSGKSGTVLTAGFSFGEQEFMVLNGGPEFSLNPSISFMVNCYTATEVETLWNHLLDGGKVLMPLDIYPFSDKYGWIEDRYGVSWQLILRQQQARQKVMPSMLFVNDVCGKAEEAIRFYTSLFHESKTGSINRYPKGMEPDKEGTIMFADFMLEGQWFAAMDNAREHNFKFNEAISLMIHCDTQDEIDYFWSTFTEDGKEMQCGWLRDKYGVTWQIVPDVLLNLIQSKDTERAKRAMRAMMQMVKLNIAELENA